MWDAKLRERAHRAHVNYWEDVSWSSKKQNSVALSTAEAEYISAGSCAQLLWMKATLSDFKSSSSKCHCYVTMRVL